MSYAPAILLGNPHNEPYASHTPLSDTSIIAIVRAADLAQVFAQIASRVDPPLRTAKHRSPLYGASPDWSGRLLGLGKASFAADTSTRAGQLAIRFQPLSSYFLLPERFSESCISANWFCNTAAARIFENHSKYDLALPPDGNDRSINDMVDHDTKVIGYFAYLSDFEVLCTQDSACIVAGSENAIRNYLAEIASIRRATIRKVRFGEIMVGLDLSGAYAFDRDAYARFHRIAQQLGLPVDERPQNALGRFVTVQFVPCPNCNSPHGWSVEPLPPDTELTLSPSARALVQAAFA